MNLPPPPKTLEDLLASSSNSDYYEEDVQDFLEDKNIPPKSHSRDLLYIQAWKAGWRPN